MTDEEIDEQLERCGVFKFKRYVYVRVKDGRIPISDVFINPFWPDVVCKNTGLEGLCVMGPGANARYGNMRNLVPDLSFPYRTEEENQADIDEWQWFKAGIHLREVGLAKYCEENP